MGLFDRLFGRDQQGAGPGYGASYGGPQDQPSPQQRADDQAIRRYQYLLQTAPPDQIERAHEEAFARLTPQQRRELLTRLAQNDPADRPADDSPPALARSATRAEMRRPGTLSRMLGGAGMGAGAGMGIGGMLLGSVAGAFIGTAIANEFFDHDGFLDWDTGGGDQSLAGEGSPAALFNDNATLDTSSIDAGGFEAAGFDAGGFDAGDFGGGFDAGGFDGGFDF